MNIKRAVGRCFDGNYTVLEKSLQLLHIFCQISSFVSIKEENGAREKNEVSISPSPFAMAVNTADETLKSRALHMHISSSRSVINCRPVSFHFPGRLGFPGRSPRTDSAGRVILKEIYISATYVIIRYAS
jgi:hypothetical protein